MTSIHPSQGSRINPRLKVCEHNWVAHASYVVKAVRIYSPKCSFFRVAQWFVQPCRNVSQVWFYELHNRAKKVTPIYCAIHRNELHTGILNSGYLLSGTCGQKLSVEWHWLKFILTQIFLHFGQFIFYSRHVCDKRLTNWTAITHTLTLNGFTRNAKHGFNFWKWSNLAWNSSSSFTIDFSILPLCGLQLPLRETHWFSFRHWENNRMRLTYVFEIFQFSSAKKLA